MRKPYPKNMSLKARETLDLFTDEEVASLTAFYDGDTSEFLGIGFINEYGKWSKFANKEKTDAIAVLDEEYQKELGEIK
jgi:hypothetical protein